MRIFEIEADGDSFVIRHDLGNEVAITGGPLSLPPGWKPRVVLQGKTQVCLLALDHPDGTIGFWFLDCSYRYLTDDIQQLTEEARVELHDALRRRSTDIWRELICAAAPSLSNATRWTARAISTLGIDVIPSEAGPGIPRCIAVHPDQADPDQADWAAVIGEIGSGRTSADCSRSARVIAWGSNGGGSVMLHPHRISERTDAPATATPLPIIAP